MDRFSFVMVLLSIIVGLGVTELLTNVARQIQSRARSQSYWVHSLLVAVVFLALLQQWLESWDQRDVESWSFVVLLLMLSGPIGLYIISHLLYPKQAEGSDFKAYYFENARMLYLIAAATAVIATLYRPVAFGDTLIDPDNISSLILLSVFLILAAFKRPVIHEILVPLLLTAVLMDVLIFIPTIS